MLIILNESIIEISSLLLFNKAFLLDIKTFKSRPRWNPPDGQGALGISIYSSNFTKIDSNYGIIGSIRESVFSVFQLFDLSVNELKFCL